MKIIDAKIRLSQDRPERTAVKFLVVGHDELCEGMIAAQDDVTAVLAFSVEANLAQRCPVY